MKVTDGVLVADSPDALPEAVEQYMVDTSAHMIHAPSIIDDESARQLLAIDCQRPEVREMRRASSEILRQALPQLSQVDEVLREWVARQTSLSRWRFLKGPTLDYFRYKGGSGYWPHLDKKFRPVQILEGSKTTPKELKAPLTMSLSLEGHSYWQAHRSSEPMYFRSGFRNLRAAVRMNSLQEAYIEQSKTRPSQLRLPAAVLQGPLDMVVVDTYLYPAIHWPATLPCFLPKDDAHKNRTAALFDYSLVKTEEALHNGY